MDRKQTIAYYIQKLSNKNFQIYDVRLELEQLKVPEEEIKIVVRTLDDELQKQLLNKNQRDSASDFIKIGIIFMIIGAAITTATWARIINTGGTFVLAYGPLIAGLSMVLVGLAKRKKKKTEDLSPKQNENYGNKRGISFRKRHE